MQVIVDELVTQYSLEGSGELVLILHGWGDSSRGFATIKKELANSYQVLAVNLPGFGGSQMPPEPWGLMDFADYLGALMKKMNLSCYAAIGHSNCGAVLIRAIASGKLNVEKLILLAPAGIKDSVPRRKRALSLVMKRGKVLTTPLPGTTKRKPLKKTYSPAEYEAEVVERLHETFQRIVADEVTNDTIHINVPTLLIYGEKDRVTPAHQGRRLGKLIADAKLEIISGGGHFVHLDYGAEVMNKIKEFLT